MTDATRSADMESDREIIQERVFDAPRALVFKAWTDAAHLTHWFGPKGFSVTTEAIDIRPGGAWQFVMQGPDGTDYANFMRFEEIVPEERLVYAHGESPDGPAHFRVTVTFTSEGARTRMRMRMVFPTAEACAATKGFGAVELGQQTLDKLAERLKTMGLSSTQTFDAPRDLV